MRMVAHALKMNLDGHRPAIRAVSWKEHLAFNHVPYRRDCRVCQESLQQVEPHRRVKHPQSAVLSVDVAGPLTPAKDQGGNQARWMLVGALTWRFPKSDKKLKTPPDEEIPEGAPKIEKDDEEDEAYDEDPEERRKKKGQDAREEADLQKNDEEEDVDPQKAPAEEDEAGTSKEDKGYAGDVRDEMEFRTFRMELPMLTKTCREVTQTVMQFIIKLKMDGYHVNQLGPWQRVWP